MTTMIRTFWRRIFPAKHCYVLVDNYGTVWAPSRKMSEQKAAKLNALIVQWNGSELRWVRALYPPDVSPPSIAEAERILAPKAGECVGYEGGCDGNLPGEEHEPNCPAAPKAGGESQNGATCGCCGRDQKHCDLRKPLSGWVKTYNLPEIICSDCMYEWYDGETDPEKIKVKVLAGGENQKESK